MILGLLIVVTMLGLGFAGVIITESRMSVDDLEERARRNHDRLKRTGRIREWSEVRRPGVCCGHVRTSAESHYGGEYFVCTFCWQAEEVAPQPRLI